MKILKLAALTAIAVNGSNTAIPEWAKESIWDLTTEGYIAPRVIAAVSVDPPGYVVTEKGQKLVSMLEACSDYFGVHQDLKEGAAEAYSAAKEDTGKIINEGKKKFNSMLDFLKIPLHEEK